MPIPAWNNAGVISPINPLAPVDVDRSPYMASLTEVVQRFGMTPPRRTILAGLLNYRAALHAIGLNRGFQWLDGSFMEQVELLEQRPPGDVDVVTFYELAPGATQLSVFQANPALFDHEHVKATFRVDAYQVHLASAPRNLVGSSTYWYSMWSHRRSDQWKGYVQVELDPAQDIPAAQDLAELQQEEAGA
jgi:hypothetical protein